MNVIEYLCMDSPCIRIQQIKKGRRMYSYCIRRIIEKGPVESRFL